MTIGLAFPKPERCAVSHQKLVRRARAWLLRNHPVVVSDLASGRETPDALGFSHGSSTLIECKASRADFRADRDKGFRRVPELGMGEARYYFMPQGLVRPEELPAGWGLLELRGDRVYEVRRSDHHEVDHRAELSILVSVLRRINVPVAGVSIRFYSIPTANRSVVIAQQEDDRNPQK